MKQLNQGFRYIVEHEINRLVFEGEDFGRQKHINDLRLDQVSFTYTNAEIMSKVVFVCNTVSDKTDLRPWNQIFSGFVAGLDPQFREFAAKSISKQNIPFGLEGKNMALHLATLICPEHFTPQKWFFTFACFIFWAASLGTASPEGWVGQLCRWEEP